MTEVLITGIKCFAAVLIGIFAGNGAVYFFNKMPAKWLCEYGEEPSEELLDKYTQRVKSYPWKFVFTMLFVVIGIKLVTDDWIFSVGAICSIWLLLEMAIADVKYRIVPDQLIILLATASLGFIQFHPSWQDCLFGALIGAGIMGFVAVLGKLLYRREALGGGDIKLFAALGLVFGIKGILMVFVMTTLLSGGHMVWLLLRKKIKRNDTIPMVPYIGIAATIQLIFLWGYIEILTL